MKAEQLQMQLSMMKSAKKATSHMVVLALFSCVVVLLYLPIGDNGYSFHENILMFAALSALIWLTAQPIKTWLAMAIQIRKTTRELKELKDSG